MRSNQINKTIFSLIKKKLRNVEKERKKREISLNRYNRNQTNKTKRNNDLRQK